MRLGTDRGICARSHRGFASERQGLLASIAGNRALPDPREGTQLHRFRLAALAAAVLSLVATSTAAAAKPPMRGVLPPSALARGHSLNELATAWNMWAFGSSVDNPLLAVRCEQSPIDPQIWFLPVSLGGEWLSTCDVPAGSFLLMNPGGSECSNIEPEPYFGTDPTDLLSCVNETFQDLTHLEVTIGGKTVTNLDPYIVVTSVINLPANNLINAAPGISRDKGYFLLLHPMSRGTHTMRAYDEFFDGAFQAGITYTINVH